MLLNGNRATSQLLATLKPIKKAIPAYFKRDVISEAGGWVFPTHKIVMRVNDESVEQDYDGEPLTEEARLIEAMTLNPYVTISFTKLSRFAPDTVNADTVSEFINYLYEHSFVPGDVEVALSPYNLKAHSQAGALNMVVIFSVDTYGEEQNKPAADEATSTTDKPRKVNPLDYLTA